ncbi:hypothetical protein BJ912DRAFT_972275 [Pholiota molesta]|nr:hypothetical protein BJ912DRAFT_972275 [Pholiota molesta]
MTFSFAAYTKPMESNAMAMGVSLSEPRKFAATCLELGNRRWLQIERAHGRSLFPNDTYPSHHRLRHLSYVSNRRSLSLRRPTLNLRSYNLTSTLCRIVPSRTSLRLLSRSWQCTNTVAVPSVHLLRTLCPEFLELRPSHSSRRKSVGVASHLLVPITPRDTDQEHPEDTISLRRGERQQTTRLLLFFDLCILPLP